MQLWLVSRSPTVQLVIILEWTKQEDNRVAGKIKVFGYDSPGQPQLVQTEVRFDCTFLVGSMGD